MQLTLKRIQTEVGITFLHVTHDQEEAMTMADTIAVMNAGHIEQLGGPVDLYEKPSTVFVANFLGQSNLITGRVTGRDGDRALVKAGDATLSVPVAGAADGTEVQIGVRPEKLRLEPESAVSDGANAIDGVVTDVSFTGVSTQYLVQTPWDAELTVFAQNTGDAQHRVGDRVHVAWRPENTFVIGTHAAADVPAPVA
jgi:spermidine/putrescine transport system ATP-binding protein